jgi:hypothetical protein
MIDDIVGFGQGRAGGPHLTAATNRVPHISILRYGQSCESTNRYSMSPNQQGLIAHATPSAVRLHY